MKETSEQRITRMLNEIISPEPPPDPSPAELARICELIVLQNLFLDGRLLRLRIHRVFPGSRFPHGLHIFRASQSFFN